MRLRILDSYIPEKNTLRDRCMIIPKPRVLGMHTDNGSYSLALINLLSSIKSINTYKHNDEYNLKNILNKCVDKICEEMTDDKYKREIKKVLDDNFCFAVEYIEKPTLVPEAIMKHYMDLCTKYIELPMISEIILKTSILRYIPNMINGNTLVTIKNYCMCGGHEDPEILLRCVDEGIVHPDLKIIVDKNINKIKNEIKFIGLEYKYVLIGCPKLCFYDMDQLENNINAAYKYKYKCVCVIYYLDNIQSRYVVGKKNSCYITYFPVHGIVINDNNIGICSESEYDREWIVLDKSKIPKNHVPVTALYVKLGD